MRVLVTGGAGFIGSALARQCVRERSWRICVIDALTYAGTRTSLAPIEGDERFTFHHLDICDADTLTEVTQAFEPDAIAHLAAETHVDRSIDGPRAFVRTNVAGTANVLEAARAYRDTLNGARADSLRVLHVSTDEVFGDLDESGLFTEQTPYNPRSPYSASKAGADHLMRAWRTTYGLNTIISNCSNNYGPYQFPEKLIPLMILNGLEGKPLPIYGDGLQVRDWLHVDDHANALALILEQGAPGETYLVGARTERTNRAVVERICAKLDALSPKSDAHSTLMSRVADRPGHDRRYAIDPSKLERELGWRPRKPFEEGLDATVQWYAENATWWRPLRANVYAGERLGGGPKS